MPITRLHHTLALAVIALPGRLSGHEIRYLRKHMGLSGRDFARLMGVRPETTSRWENDKDPIAVTPDRFLRHLIRTYGPETEIDYALSVARAKSGWRQTGVG